MTYHSTYDGAGSLGSKWGWFLALGLALLILGGIAFSNILMATAVSVYYIGVLMVVGGAVQLFHAFQVKGWKSTIFWVLSGGLYVIAGLLAFSNPLMVSMVLTLCLAIMLIAAGGVRMAVGFSLRPVSGWAWMAFSGFITLLVGVVITIGWPANSIFMLGLFLAADLIVQGLSLVFFSLFMKSTPDEHFLEGETI